VADGWPVCQEMRGLGLYARPSQALSSGGNAVSGVAAAADAAPKFKLTAIEGLRRWKQEAATRITEKKKKKLTLKGYSRVG